VDGCTLVALGGMRVGGWGWLVEVGVKSFSRLGLPAVRVEAQQ